MDVSLYVYDLSRGVARSMSMQFLGIQIDAVYHTAIVLNGVEYFFGQGVQTCYPGTTHHGQPMEKVALGQTQLPMDVILDYLESLKEIYTPESYDLFAHNCNNFSNDFSMFLVGKGIPTHITSLPETVLQTPFGQMLKPQIDASMRSMTQAPVPPQNVPPQAKASTSVQSSQNKPAVSIAASNSSSHGEVYNVTQISVLDKLLTSAKSSCAVIFFTSSTCAPCKLAYPTYDSLAAENPLVPFIKVDINAAQDIGSRYSIRATPTFKTFLHGTQENEWMGANPSQLRSNVSLLLQKAYPPHPHSTLRVPSLSSGSLRPVSFPKIPPLDKLLSKMGSSGSSPAVQSIKSFLLTRAEQGAASAPLPSLPSFSAFLLSSPTALPPDTLFTAYDLLRCALLDVRAASFFAEEHPSTILSLLNHATSLISDDKCPYNLRLVSVQLAANLFLHPLSTTTALSTLALPITNLVSTSLLVEKDKPALRAAAAGLGFNLAAANYRVRREAGREALDAEQQVELAASLVEFLGSDGVERNGEEGVLAAVTAVGYLTYYCERDGEVWDLCRAVGARDVVQGLVGGKGEVGKVAVDVVKVLPESE